MGSAKHQVSADESAVEEKKPSRAPIPVQAVRFLKPIDLPNGSSSSGWAYGKVEGTDCHYLPWMRHFEFTYQRPGTNPQNDDMPWPTDRRMVWEGHVERWDPR